jgi:intein/homing endonuclease
MPAIVVERHTDYLDQLVEIVLENNRKILATPEHAMLVGHKLDIVYAKNVAVG